MRRRWLLFLTIFISISLSFSASIKLGPIVQNITPYAVTISWWTDEKDAGEVFCTDGKEHFSLQSKEGTYQKVRITGLKPDRLYTYRVEGNNYTVGPFTFRTAPFGSKPFRFAVYGDTRTQDEIHREIVRSVKRYKPAFVIHTGDLVADGNQLQQWENFFKISQELLQTTPIYPVLGNHEKNSPLYFRFFSLPGAENYYSFNWGDCHIIALDSNEEYLNSPSQLKWFREDLELHKNYPYIIVFFHHPPFTLIEDRKSYAQKVREVIVPILEKYKVSVVFHGHDHNYQHFYVNGINYIVAGGGGAPLYSISKPDRYTVKAEKVYNYIICDVDENKLVLRAYRLGGSLLEKIEIKPRVKKSSITVKLPKLEDEHLFEILKKKGISH